MYVNTAGALLKIIQADTRDTAILLSEDKRIQNGSSISGYLMALAFAGPVIGKIVWDNFRDAIVGPEGSDPMAETTLIGGFVSKLKSTVVDMVNDFLGLPKAGTTSTLSPASASAPVATPLVNSGAKVSANLGSPSESVEDALRSVSLKEKIDYGILYSIAGAESTFKTDAQAGTSSATGLFQFTESTWNYLTKKSYPELGYKPSDRKDATKSATVASRYIKTIQEVLTKALGAAPSLGQIYLGYFMGPTGARSFLKALKENASQFGAKLFPNQAKANKNLFYKDGKPLTLQETLDKLEGKVSVYYAQASKSTVLASSNQPGAPIGQASQVLKLAQPSGVSEAPKVAAATAVPANQQVSKADLPSKAKVARYAQADTDEGNYLLPGGNSNAPEVTYLRDRQNRITAVPS